MRSTHRARGTLTSPRTNSIIGLATPKKRFAGSSSLRSCTNWFEAARIESNINPPTCVTNNIFTDGVVYATDFLGCNTDKFTNNIVYEGQILGTQLFYSIAPGALGKSDNNLLLAPLTNGSAAQLAAWQAAPLSFDAHSIVTDPLFVDYAHDNFALKSASRALLPIGSGGIGFKAIDFTGLPKL